MGISDLLIKPKKGFFTKLKEFFVGEAITDEVYEELEELLIQADLGMKMTLEIVENLEKNVRSKGIKSKELMYDELKLLLSEKLEKFKDNSLNIQKGRLNIILVIGVNGVGKTTSIGKIAMKLKKEGKSVIIGAADTFRAAAIEQVEMWGQRAGIEVIKQKHGSDPAAVVFDTINTAKSKNIDVAIIDTAGRLHNKVDLMKELEKIDKIIKQNVDEYESLIVVDSTTGQNGLEQARMFNNISNITGVILTKFDGTAKGGIIFSIVSELNKPVKFLGVGEGVDDLKVFDCKEFINEMFN
ncbi:signal recognition particle-docking protein FtsY [Streptobacillus moniliformis]|uniref:Signal recognition particle receptor FtsY n=1 Tax=Streptobacillus moniliformis (strain ATCC 14647 / DSM 12112 / NCTC 10651 / 9901) TaxID=519441 RepID=D1AW96_STRM9|nr:signal recognition particle-docking protein FtsY [Streptobacillus moniliformis]ACZ00572.1 signal recognition particle-docking protein FtsY [Streptobacillus moniliformis DSM 12112]SQA14309.1 Cell division protein FtsY homolog [Streptobacillus moniliformis]